jgi:tRNA dimethylallyltransferase
VKLVVIAGPTGSGKSELAHRLASESRGEIVNYDSVQLYRGFDVGSAKPTSAERAAVPHHLYDILDADQEFNAADYARVAKQTAAEIAARGRVPIFVGGTFFYLRALVSGLPEMPGRDEAIRARIRRIASKRGGPEKLHRWLSKVDPVTAARIPPPDRHRVERAPEVWVISGQPISTWARPSPESDPDLEPLKIGLTIPRPQLVERLDARVEAMYRNGLVEETRALLARYSRESRPFGAIGYAEAAALVAGEMDVAGAIAETKRRTRAYAKRQMTWLRSERNMQWVEATDREQTFRAALRLMERSSIE